jgi:hypothetical protein
VFFVSSSLKELSKASNSSNVNVSSGFISSFLGISSLFLTKDVGSVIIFSFSSVSLIHAEILSIRAFKSANSSTIGTTSSTVFVVSSTTGVVSSTTAGVTTSVTGTSVHKSSFNIIINYIMNLQKS